MKFFPPFFFAFGSCLFFFHLLDPLFFFFNTGLLTLCLKLFSSECLEGVFSIFIFNLTKKMPFLIFQYFSSNQKMNFCLFSFLPTCHHLLVTRWSGQYLNVSGSSFRQVYLCQTLCERIINYLAPVKLLISSPPLCLWLISHRSNTTTFINAKVISLPARRKPLFGRYRWISGPLND